MYPVSGGTARFPHFAFGSVAGISFGFFSWLQAVTVAPIECFAVMQYGVVLLARPVQRRHGQGHHVGFVMTHPADGGLHRDQLPRHAPVQQGEQRHHLVEGRDPGPRPSSSCCSSSTPATSAAGGGLPAAGVTKAIFAAIPGAGIVFAYLGFEQADQLAGEIKNPQKNLPRAIIIAILIGTAIYVMLQVVFIGAMQPSAAHATAGCAGTWRPTRLVVRAVRRPRWRWSASAGWRSSCGSTRSSPRSAPA